ncbi:hypothetical protein FC62_GL001131 [Amylolactobacillus amylotrophicus DSM 20534]|uniref:Inner membrane component domain-containing protein n=3 Tax=Amylolactobacillus TaxID=2767876 RepID=A0A0R1YH83_9LACO|nr:MULTISPECIES: YccF domain-containing protein [Amylolactobacillus]APT18640.1 hypothetical protein LA20533_04905 [Amylolactobacillus amylophilus DSM 20533 = JCM 1125]KRK37797.1 hypothetical protein FC62_GL001131 [Amylolactobacillus amylotrophicus DSM 20534]KRM41585.1 hypothetical protein FD40_GL001426 [Amylolactobacillus amylophilus DSM 20533 = JCM 1125]GED81035.1 hypothetical protein LAM01_15080 [Amylolactobacillus amylophilus]
MKLIGNIIWFIFGGLGGALAWFGAGLLWSITIVGLPIGVQCFKFARLSLAPFNKEVVYHTTTTNFVVNVIWLLISGLPLALTHLASALLLTITIIGIPFAKQSLKLAGLSLRPFGATIV